MNIFILNSDPVLAAQDHCDKHLPKMAVEYAQMLSSAHRFHDGELQSIELPDGKSKRLRLLVGEECKVVPRAELKRSSTVKHRSQYAVQVVNQRCYLEAHANHPCTIWTRQTDSNYQWLFHLFEATCAEYTRRYGRIHGSERIKEFLQRSPINIESGNLTPFAQAMPDEYKAPDAVEAYRRFYIGAKSRFAKWKYTAAPTWYLEGAA